jgi:two-component system sensor histidine kinase UhpB
VASQGLRGLRTVPLRRAAEFAAVVAGMLVGGLLVAQSAVDPAYRWLLHAPMPLLLWAAVRFGPPGLCIALFVIVFVFVGEVFGGPFIAASPAENAVALQVFLIAIAVPLQLLAALVEERRRADDRIAESRQRYRMATRAGGVGVWDWDLETHQTYVDPVLKGALGYADAEAPHTIEAWAALVHPDDAALVWDAVQACVDGRTTDYAVEHRMLHRDGTARWFLARGAVSAHRDGRPVRMTGTGTDITERKAAEAALDESSRRIRDLTGRLMVAQEQERRHIARELHDDVSQQVAAISISISNIKRALARGATAERASTELGALQRNTAELAEAIRELSHGLHPAALEHGGLTAGLKSFAAELSRREGLDVAITAVGDDGAIPPHVALALYRIVQESMRNVARHSGARQAQVIMTVSDAAVELLVKDEGSGFDVRRSRHGDGLGLISIEERVRLLQGSLLVTSRPGHGTDLLVQVPLAGALRADHLSPEPAGAVRGRAYWQHTGTGEVWAVETQAGHPVRCAGPITPAAAGAVALSSVTLGADDVRIIRAQWPRFVRRDLCSVCDTVILPGASTVAPPTSGRAHLRCALNPPVVHADSAGARVRREPLWQTSARLATQSQILQAASFALRARCEALRAAWRRRLLRDGRAER